MAAIDSLVKCDDVINLVTSYITKSGKAKCVILLPDNATSGEVFASQELQIHIKLITGVELVQVHESQYNMAMGPYISIGKTNLRIWNDRFACISHCQTFLEPKKKCQKGN